MAACFDTAIEALKARGKSVAIATLIGQLTEYKSFFVSASAGHELIEKELSEIEKSETNTKNEFLVNCAKIQVDLTRSSLLGLSAFIDNLPWATIDDNDFKFVSTKLSEHTEKINHRQAELVILLRVSAEEAVG